MGWEDKGHLRLSWEILLLGTSAPSPCPPALLHPQAQVLSRQSMREVAGGTQKGRIGTLLAHPGLSGGACGSFSQGLSKAWHDPRP